jgi:aspartate/methionine/tyrosine aminotransferase
MSIGSLVVQSYYLWMQEAATAALHLGPKGGEPVAEMVAEFRRRRDFMVQRLQGIDGLHVAPPDGAFYVLPECSAFFGDGVEAEGFGPVPDVDALCSYLLKVGLVACVPGSAFGAPSCLRISYAASMADLVKAADRIESCLSPKRLRRGCL